MSDIRKYNLRDVTNICNKELDLFEKLQLIVILFKELGFIEITEYSKLYGISDKTVRNRIKAGKLPYKILGKTIFIIKKLD